MPEQEPRKKTMPFLPYIISGIAVGTAVVGGLIFGNYMIKNYNPNKKPETAVTAPAGNLEEKLTGINQALNQNNQTLDNLSTQYQDVNRAVIESVKDSTKATTDALRAQGNQIAQAINEQGDKTAQAIRHDYDKTIKSNQENYEEVVTAIRESRKEDPGPIAPEPTADKLANRLLNEVKDEPGKKEPEVPETPYQAPIKPVVPRTPNPYSLSVTPYAGMKFALSSESQPEPMPAFGLELEIGKDDSRWSFYFGGQYGEMDSRESSPLGSFDLKSKETGLRLGTGFNLINNERLRLALKAGARVNLEENEIKGTIGTYDVDDSRKETIIGAEAGLGLELKLTENISLTAGAEYGHNFSDDNSNVTDDLTGKVGVTLRF